MKILQKLKNMGINFVKGNPWLSHKTSILLRLLGFELLGEKISYKTRSIPDIIPIRLPAHINSRKNFKLYTASGKDQIASNIWFLGWKSFEKPLPDIFSACVCKSSGIVIDVGANTGFYSLLAIYSSPEVRVHAFEPYLPVKQIFEKNITLNKANDRINVFDWAVSDSIGETELYVPSADHGLVETSCSLNKGFKDSHSFVVKVLLTTLDEHIRQHNITGVDILKIDVESLEHKVLQGAAHLLQKQRPIVFFELLPVGHAAKLEEIRQSNRYVGIRLHSSLAVIDTEVAYDTLTWNHILVPEEKLEWLKDILKKSKLAFIQAR